MLQRGAQATTLQLTPATEGRNQRGRGPTVQTPSLEKLVTHTQCACRLRKEGYGTLQVLNGHQEEEEPPPGCQSNGHQVPRRRSGHQEEVLHCSEHAATLQTNRRKERAQRTRTRDGRTSGHQVQKKCYIAVNTQQWAPGQTGRGSVSQCSLQRDPEGPSQPNASPGTQSMSRPCNSRRHQPSSGQPNHL
jgi:hypothetical protein